jgi:hypothetical protein
LSSCNFRHYVCCHFKSWITVCCHFQHDSSNIDSHQSVGEVLSTPRHLATAPTLHGPASLTPPTP